MAKEKKSALKIVIIVFGIIVLIACLIYAGMAIYVRSSMDQCSNRADEQTKTLSENDRARTEAYMGCMQDKGLGGFATIIYK